ncbi:unnamed protein product [Adineta steineri]|uniref:Uncharacterized protein n=1 Tax=Adineta steineri TaxID=433720 RepID=A0A813S2H1_9BILA|nr:unnamed protein product [Adineta steineri]
MFANNPLSGLIITIGLFIGNCQLACYGLLGTFISTLTAHIYSLTYQALGGMFFVLHGYKIWILTLYGSLMTLIVQTCISSFLNPVVSNFNGFIYEGNLDAIRCLISCGLNPNNSDYDGKNALHLAIVANHYDIKISSEDHFQQILLRQDRWGFYSIDEARKNHFYHIVNELQ